MALSILVEPGSYPLHNHGDNAMLRVATSRLKEIWPTAEISVTTARPDRLPLHCPSARPVNEEERRAWLSGQSLLGGWHDKLPTRFSTLIRRLENTLWIQYPRMAGFGVALKARAMLRKTRSPLSFFKQLTQSDLLIVCGMGLINDAFEGSALALLEELSVAIRAGVQVVAMGQGIGPITTPALRAKASEVLPKLSLIALREGRTGPTLLESLGVASERVVITGDDAIELAYDRRKSSIGNSIGINLRQVAYSQIDNNIIAKLRIPIQQAADYLNSAFAPVPISFSDESHGMTAINLLLQGARTICHSDLEVLDNLLDTVGKCRLVIASSYHAGVFALSQGIPVIALINSDYYEHKFLGLKEQFPEGCIPLDLRKPTTSDDIRDTICRVWESAESVREALLKSAEKQIALSRAAYSSIPERLSWSQECIGSSLMDAATLG